MKRLRDSFLSLQFLFKPMFWGMNESYSTEWDKKLNDMMSKYDFTDIENCTAKLNGMEIWITNYPYSTFMPYERNSGNRKHKYRPSRLTIKRAMEKLEKDMYKQFGRVKSTDERQKDLIEEIKRHKREREEIQKKINELTESIRLHPHNVSKYNKKGSLQHNTIIRKFTMKYK